MDREVYAGWDDYYAEAGKSAWKDEADPAVHEMMKMYAEPRRVHVGDFGCGDGRNLWPWVHAGARTTGVDISLLALERIRESCLQHDRPCPTLINEDFSSTDLVAGQFDVVQCYDALHQVVDPAKALAEFVRLARPGGHVGFNVFTPRDCAFGEGEAIDSRTFVFRRTLFRFFEEADARAIIPSSTEIVSARPRRWTDPPHFPFRPQPHTHDGIFYVLRRAL